MSASAKAALLSQAAECSRKANEFFSKRDTAKTLAIFEANGLEQRIQAIFTEINKRKQKAGKLAQEFRRLYGESQDAYNDGDGELAKELSEQGREAQNDCEQINKETKELYQNISNLNVRKKELFASSNSWHKLAMEEIEKAKELRRRAAEIADIPPVVLRGMPSDFQQAITDTLKSLPANHTSSKLIDWISHSGKYIVGQSGNPVQANTHFNKVTGKATIVINRQTQNGFSNINDIKIATAHEIGHVVYRMILDDSQRDRWANEFNHMRGEEESFAVSYWYYHFKADEMSKESPKAKSFFDQLNL